MKFLVALTLLLAWPGRAAAQAGPGGPGLTRDDVRARVGELRILRDQLRMESTYSHSGQFIVYAPTAGTSPRPPALTQDPNLIVLDPKLLAVSCERTRQALLHLLDTTAPWRGKIVVYLRPARTANDPITMLADKRPSGWTYQVELPDCLEQSRFVRTIVDVLLLEMANRSADSHSAEIPAWLAEGLSQEMVAANGTEILLSPPDHTENGVNFRRQTVDMSDAAGAIGQYMRKLNPLSEAQAILRARAPLTFDELSWPSADQLTGEGGRVYRGSAQLFMEQLLALPNGPACLRAMLDELPRHYNWQFAFFAGFSPHFQKPIDVEKWWALQLVQFAGRDLTQIWTPEESWRRLDETIRLPVGVRSAPAELPLRAEVTIQTALREWDLLSQGQMLQRKQRDLDLLRPRTSPELIGLLDDYRQVIGTYLQKRNMAGRLLPSKKGARRISDKVTDETVRQLDGLDARRTAWQPAAPAPALMPGDSPLTAR